MQLLISILLWCVYQFLQASSVLGLLITTPTGYLFKGIQVLFTVIKNAATLSVKKGKKAYAKFQKNCVKTYTRVHNRSVQSIHKLVHAVRARVHVIRTRVRAVQQLWQTAWQTLKKNWQTKLKNWQTKRKNALAKQKKLQAKQNKLRAKQQKLLAKQKKARAKHHNKWQLSAQNRARLLSSGIWLFLLPLAIWTGNLVASTVNSYILALPNPTTLADFKTPAATLVYDRSGVLLYSAYDDIYRVPVPLSKVPQVLIDATIQSEDARFYTHHGIDPQGVARAIVNNLQHKPTQGASTITQQLARVAFLTQEHTLKRKLDEAIIAIKIEQNFTKDQILELYFNTIPYGGVTVGVQAASKHYFQKNVEELTPTEAVFLASLTPAPSVYAQLAQENPADYGRIRLLADELLSNGKVSQEDYDQIVTTELSFSTAANYKRAPHAVDFVLAQVLEKASQNAQFSSGVSIYTTIDLELQNKLQQAVLSEVIKSGERYNFSNASLLVVDPHTGEVRAMIGSANYYETQNGQVNVTTAPRQLGSTLKIVPYALALESGMSPTSMIVDEPVQFPGYQNYRPRNYDGKFHGSVTLTEALGNSYNIPALKLANQLGIQHVANQGVRMGISEFAQLQAPLPLTLAIGGVETSLFNVTQAYQIVADGGEKQPLHVIDRIADHRGIVLYQDANTSERILSEQTAQQLTEMLSSPAAREAMFGRSAYFDFGSNKVAIKTGTSNNLKDNVAIAFTDSFVVATWTGNNSGESMANIASGQTGATPIMHQATSIVLQQLTSTQLVSTN